MRKNAFLLGWNSRGILAEEFTFRRYVLQSRLLYGFNDDGSLPIAEFLAFLRNESWLGGQPLWLNLHAYFFICCAFLSLPMAYLLIHHVCGWHPKPQSFLRLCQIGCLFCILTNATNEPHVWLMAKTKLQGAGGFPPKIFWHLLPLQGIWTQ